MSHKVRMYRVLIGVFFGLISVAPMQGLAVSDQNSKVAQMDFYNEAYFNRFHKTLTLNFQQINVRSLLQLLAQSVGANIVVSDDVTGTMSIHVKQVPWYEAFKIVLVTQNLGVRQFGRVWEVAKKESLIKAKLQELQFGKRLSVLTPIESKVIKLHYADAKTVAEMVRKTLYDGRVNNTNNNRVYFNQRTNTIWIRDTKYNINQVRDLVRKLDVPVKQVGIDAQVFSVNVDDIQDIGAQFGINGRSSGISGTLAGGDALRAGTLPSITDRLNFNQSVRTSSSSSTETTASKAASIALSQFDITDRTFLDLQLSLLAEEKLIKILSNPHVVTSDNTTATISSGEEIPYQESTSSGATNISFKPAELSLEVRPQVTRDNKVILHIKINEDKRGDVADEVNGEPAIDTQKIVTSVLLKNGDTIMIGGIYRNTSTKAHVRVPFLSDLPIIGHLFKSRTTRYSKEELVILLTPHFAGSLLKKSKPKNSHYKLIMDLPYYDAFKR